jgi:hypothetical protein
MEPYQIFHKSHRHQLVLLVVLILYIVLNIQTPSTLAHLIDNIYGNIAVILCAFYLLANSNPVVGVIALFAAYELIKRSSYSTGTAAINKYLPTEMKKGVHLSAFNQFPVTLEEEVVKDMAPLISSGGPNSLHYKPVMDDTHNAMNVHDTTSVI